MNDEVSCETDCGCGAAAAEYATAPRGYRLVLWIVLLMNAAMFVVEAVFGQVAGSMALQADALDFAADAATYSITLVVLGQSIRVRSAAALIKGASLGLMGAYVLGAAVWRTFVEGAPEALTMGVIGSLALATNLGAAVLLFFYRTGDANMRSVWLCTRNDAIGNIAVLAAAGVVALTATKWADLGVAVIMASLFLNSSLKIIRQARREQAQAIRVPVRTELQLDA